MLVREFPQAEIVEALAKQYAEVDPSAVIPYLAFVFVSRELTNVVDAKLAKHGLSHGRFAIMVSLWHFPPETGATPAELAERCVVARATVSGLLDGLEKDGLVERTNRTDDRRTVAVRLTRTGSALLDRVFPEHYRRIGSIMGALNKGERKELARLLVKLRAGLRAVA